MARVLFAFAGGRGHLNPLLPLARALRGRGHELALTGRASATATTRLFDAVFPEGPAVRADREIDDLVAPDLDHELAVIGRYFAGRSAVPTAARVADVVRRWAPDLLVADEMDFGALVAAEAACVPRVVVSTISSGALVRPEHVTAPLAELRHAQGLPADPDLAMLRGDLLVHPFPISLRDPSFPLPPGTLVVRPEDPEPGQAHEAAAWIADGDGPRVLVTLGTIFNAESGDVFTRLLAGARDLAARVLVCVGEDLDPRRFGDQPSHVRIERYVPQHAVLPHCDLVTTHGGSGSVVGALSHGVPLLVVALGADQELNAERVVRVGTGERLDPTSFTPADLRSAVLRLTSPGDGARAAAERIRAEAAALPRVRDVVEQIEAVARVS